MQRFEVGKTYSCRSACDYECVWNYEVVKRTDKSIMIKRLGQSVTSSRRITNWDNKECIWPMGKGSMQPILRAGGN
jgi:hypothetical protein